MEKRLNANLKLNYDGAMLVYGFVRNGIHFHVVRSVNSKKTIKTLKPKNTTEFCTPILTKIDYTFGYTRNGWEIIDSKYTYYVLIDWLKPVRLQGTG